MKTKNKLPKWFNGLHYGYGAEVKNPFSGETYELNSAELSMYDCVKGAEMIMLMGAADIDSCMDVIDQGKDWFLARNPLAYMTLLD